MSRRSVIAPEPLLCGSSPTMAISAHSEAAVVGRGDASLASRKEFRVFERAKIATRNWETAPGKELFLTGERVVLLERMAEPTLTVGFGLV